MRRIFRTWKDERMADQPCSGLIAYDQIESLWIPSHYVYDLLDKVDTIKMFKNIF